MSELMTPMKNSVVEDFVDKVPKAMKMHMTLKVKAELEKMLCDEEVGDVYQEGVSVNTDLMAKYSAHPEKYLRAVKFVSYLNIGKKQFEAFALSHPEKYLEYKQQAEDENWDRVKLRNKLSLKGSNFKGTQIVTELLARNTVPLAIRYSDYRNKAVERLATLMDSAESERVQMESADKLLTHLNLDKTEFRMTADIEDNHGSVISTLAGVLDKMVSMHQNEKEVNPSKSNASILEGVVAHARGNS